MQLIKFGGAALKNIDGFNSLISAIRKNESDKLVLVISAFSHTTRHLIDSANSSEKGSLDFAKKKVSGIISEYRNFGRQLIKSSKRLETLESILGRGEDTLQQIMKGISITQELTPRTLDYVMSFGEFYAAKTVEQILLEYNFSAKFIDAADVIVTDNNYGRARPVFSKTDENVYSILRPEIKKNDITIIQGFAARGTNGEITTMGIESSNLTAALLADLLKIKQLTLFTDVEGIRSADPEIVQNTKLIGELNYPDAMKLSQAGLKLIYPAMIDRAEKAGIELIYKSAYSEGPDFTRVKSDPKPVSHPIILLNRNLKLVRADFKSAEKSEEFRYKYFHLLSTKDIPLLRFDGASLMLLAGKYFKVPQTVSNLAEIEIVDEVSQINIFCPENMPPAMIHEKISGAVNLPETLNYNTDKMFISMLVYSHKAEFIYRKLHELLIA